MQIHMRDKKWDNFEMEAKSLTPNISAKSLSNLITDNQGRFWNPLASISKLSLYKNHKGAWWTEGPYEKFQFYILPMKNLFFFLGIF